MSFNSFLQRIKEIILAIVAAIWEAIIISWLAAYYVTESLMLFLTPTFMRAQKSLRGRVVLITGGAGGVGQELALRLARLKANVVIWDINEKGKT